MASGVVKNSKTEGNTFTCSQDTKTCLPPLITLQQLTVLVVGILGILKIVSPVILGWTMVGVAGISFNALMVLPRDNKINKVLLISQLAMYAIAGGLTIGGLLPIAISPWVMLGTVATAACPLPAFR
jgi:hypothetical protein